MDYFDFGGDTGLGYDINDAVASDTSFSGGGLLDGLFGLAGQYLKADTAIKLQQAGSGTQYVEGQPIVVNVPAQVQPAGGGLNISPGLLLLAGLGVMLYMSKD